MIAIIDTGISFGGISFPKITQPKKKCVKTQNKIYNFFFFVWERYSRSIRLPYWTFPRHGAFTANDNKELNEESEPKPSACNMWHERGVGLGNRQSAMSAGGLWAVGCGMWPVACPPPPAATHSPKHDRQFMNETKKLHQLLHRQTIAFFSSSRWKASFAPSLLRV